MLDRYGATDPDEADPIVGTIILEFAKVDPGSYAYRYPVDTQGRLLPVTQSDLHLPTLADVMNGVSGYFRRLRRILGQPLRRTRLLGAASRLASWVAV